MLGADEMNALVKGLLTSGVTVELKSEFFSAFSPDIAHGVLSLLINEFAEQLKDKNAKVKRRVCSRFFKAIKHCCEHGATMQHPAFFANIPSEHDHPLIVLMNIHDALPSNQKPLLFKSLQPLFLTASADVLDSKLPSDIKRSPWQFAVENKLEPWLDVMREPLAFSAYSMSLLPSILLTLSMKLLDVDVNTKGPLVAMDQMPLVPSIIYPLIEFFERGIKSDKLIGIARVIFQQWLEKLVVKCIYNPMDPVLLAMKKRVSRFYQQIGSNVCTTTIRWQDAPLTPLKQNLIDPAAHPVSLDDFRAKVAMLSTEQQEYLIYDSLRIFSQCEPGFWCFNTRKMNNLSAYYKVLFDQPAVDLAGTYQGKSYYLATFLAMHSGMVSLLSACLVSLFEKALRQEKLARFVREAFQAAMANNNDKAVQYIVEMEACKTVFDEPTLLGRLKEAWDVYPYHLDIVYYFLYRISQLNPLQFQTSMKGEIFNDPAYQKAYLRVAYQHLLMQLQEGRISEIEVGFFNWHFSRILPIISYPNLTQCWNLASTHYAALFVLNDNAFVNMLLNFCDQPLYAADPYELLSKSTFLIEKGVLFKLTVDDLDLCDRLMKTADVMPSKRGDIEALVKCFLPVVQAAKIEALNDTISDMAIEITKKVATLADVKKVSEARKKQCQQQKKESSALMAENQDLKIALAKSELTRSMESVFSDFSAFEGKVDQRAALVCHRLQLASALVTTVNLLPKSPAKAHSVDASSATAESESSPLPAEISVPVMMDAAVQVKRSSSSKRRLKALTSDYNALKTLCFQQKCQLEFQGQFSPEQKRRDERSAFLEAECQRLSAWCCSLDASNRSMASQLMSMGLMPSAAPPLPFYQASAPVKKPLKVSKPPSEPL